VLSKKNCKLIFNYFFRANERKTENSVRKYLMECGYFDKVEFNTSLTAINLAKISHWLSEPKKKRGPFSMSDIKRDTTMIYRQIDLFASSG
jgi:hypothetical protein